jgi:hypothetical protein
MQALRRTKENLFMASETINPYAVSASVSDVAAERVRAEPWKAIALRWEKLRLIYNLAVGSAGVLAMLMMAPLTGFDVLGMIGGAICYGLGANVCYLFGPITEMYLNWLTDLGEEKFIPRFLARWIRGRYLTLVMWLIGTIGSVMMTLLIGLMALVLSGLKQD